MSYYKCMLVSVLTATGMKVMTMIPTTYGGRQERYDDDINDLLRQAGTS